MAKSKTLKRTEALRRALEIMPRYPDCEPVWQDRKARREINHLETLLGFSPTDWGEWDQAGKEAVRNG